MVECSVCGSACPDAARYCGNCGSALREVHHPSAFEVGRIAALDSIKSGIVKWLALPFTIVTAVAGVLGYFGVSNIITTQVQTQVQADIDKNLARVSDEMNKRFIDVASEEGAVKTLEQETKKTLDTAKLELADLQESKKQLIASLQETKDDEARLTSSIQSATGQERQLEQSISTMNLGPFIAKLRYDFYHVREFRLAASIDIDPQIDPRDLTDFPHAEYVALLGENGVRLARLERSSASSITDSKGVNGIDIKFALAAAEQDKIIGQKIEVLSDLTGAQLVFYCAPQFRDRLQAIVKSVTAIHLAVLTNGRPLWQVDVSKPGLTITEASKADGASFLANMQLERYGDSLLARYEGAFTGKFDGLLTAKDPP